MVIRNGKLYRICVRCHRHFLPTGKHSKICDSCIKVSGVKANNSQKNNDNKNY